MLQQFWTDENWSLLKIKVSELYRSTELQLRPEHFKNKILWKPNKNPNTKQEEENKKSDFLHSYQTTNNTNFTIPNKTKQNKSIIPNKHRPRAEFFLYIDLPQTHHKNNILDSLTNINILWNKDLPIPQKHNPKQNIRSEFFSKSTFQNLTTTITSYTH